MGFKNGFCGGWDVVLELMGVEDGVVDGIYGGGDG